LGIIFLSARIKPEDDKTRGPPFQGGTVSTQQNNTSNKLTGISEIEQQG
jgi:hypothetical protein